MLVLDWSHTAAAPLKMPRNQQHLSFRRGPSEWRAIRMAGHSDGTRVRRPVLFDWRNANLEQVAFFKEVM